MENLESYYGVAFCDQYKAEGTDGILYGVHYASSSPYTESIVAYDGDTEQWRYALTETCPYNSSTVRLSPQRLVMGADGYLYVLSAAQSGCSSTKFLSKLRLGSNPSGGRVAFTHAVGDQGYSWLSATSTGLVAYYQYDTLRFFNYDGTEEPSVQVQESGASSTTPVAADMDGRIVIAIQDYKTQASGCQNQGSGNIYTRLLVGYDSGGKVMDYAVPNCSSVQSTTVATNGDTVFTAVAPETLWMGTVSLVSGQPVAETELPYEKDEEYHYYGAGYVIADTNGSVMHVRSFYKTWSQIHAQFTLRTTAHDTKAVLDSNSLGSQTWYRDFALSNGALYVSLAECGNSSCPVDLYRVAFAELGMDYPRGAALGVQPQNATLALDVIGDSYASGEGVEPFDPATDTAGPPENRCHRSEKAYAHLLNANPAVPLQLNDFAACSGATTETIQQNQLGALGANTKRVTVSAGGNDIGFGGALVVCSTVTTINAQMCEEALDTVNDGVHSTWFRDDLAALYAAISTEAPNAEVFVVGYPLFMGLPNEPHCNWPLHTMTATEEALVDDIGTTLNAVLADEAAQAGFTFVPVASVFGSHTVCDSDPYVNGADVMNQEYSYHPNAKGIAVIAGEIAAAMS